MPDTEEHNSYLAGVISEAAEKLRENGISYQLNYQNLFGSWDGNFDHRDMLTWECYVDEYKYGVYEKFLIWEKESISPF